LLNKPNDPIFGGSVGYTLYHYTWGPT